ncbi:MAG: DUF2071 domain-containing protein [Gemmatimonadaceae bacterium]
MTWALRMTWIDLAFLHWQVPRDVFVGKIPVGLELDTYNDTAWLGVTPFRMTGVRPIFTPPIPTASDFPELNVRTYVRYKDVAGVFFFSLDAASKLAVKAARTATGLPYFHARMHERRDRDEVHYTSVRSRGPKAEFRGRYRPTGLVDKARLGSLDHWLTERYSLFVERDATLIRLDIEHEQWPLQPASTDIEVNTMAEAAGISLPAEKPYVLFSRQIDVVAHWPVSA